MRKIKGINTAPEIALRKALWKLGVRYRLNVAELPGKPDIVIRKSRLVIFVDGEFWHGFEWGKKKPRIVANRDYWVPKIERTIKRDLDNNAKLASLGFIVLRFWEREIKKSLPQCVSKVMELVGSDFTKIR